MRFDFIVPAGRGGSLLLQSLFDGHPDLITLPGFIPFFGYGRGVNPTDASQIMETFGDALGLVPQDDGGTSSRGLAPLDASYRRALARALSLRCAQLSARSGEARYLQVLEVMHEAAADVRGYKDIDRALLHFHDVRRSDSSLFARMFPKARVFIAARDPLISIDRWMGILSSRNQPLDPRDVYDSSIRHARWWIDVKALFNILGSDNVMLIDLPHLHAGGRQGIETLAAWLDLTPDRCLVESTLGGIPWQGNSSSGRAVYGLRGKESASDALRLLSDEHQSCLGYFFSDVRSSLGYEPSVARSVPSPHLRARLLVSALQAPRRLTSPRQVARVGRQSLALGVHNSQILDAIAVGRLRWKLNPVASKSHVAQHVQSMFLPSTAR